MLATYELTVSALLSNAAWLTVKAVVILAVAALAIALLPRLSASARFCIAFYALIATMLLPLFSSALPTLNVVPNWFVAATGQRHADVVAVATPRPASVAGNPNTAAVARPGAPTQAQQSFGFVATPATLVWAAWLLGVVLLTARIGLALRRVSRMESQAAELRDPQWEALLDECARTMGLSDLPTLLFHPEPIMPITVGVRRTRILLPVDAQDWPTTRKKDVLLHEMAHIRRNDLANEWLGLIACTAQWFNPLVWWAQRRMIIERERACDDLVLTAGADPAGYADCLLKTAAQFSSRPGPFPGMARASDLETRLLAVLDTSQTRGVASRWARIAIAAVGLGVVLPIASLAVDPGASLAAPAVAPEQSAQDQLEIDRLRELLGSGDRRQRQQARNELDALGASHRIVTGLDEQLFARYNSDSELFRDYSTVDARAGTAAGPNALLSSLRAASAIERAAAAKALGNIKTSQVVQALAQSLGDANWHVREWSARSLGQIGDASAVAALVGVTSDDSAAVREWSVRALGSIADPGAVDGLLHTLADNNGDVREWTARALGSIGSARAVDGLIVSLQDSDADVREWALRALGDIGDARAIDAIAALAQDENADVREWSERSLQAVRAKNR